MRAWLLTLLLLLAPGCLDDAPDEALDEAGAEEPAAVADEERPRVSVRENHWLVRTSAVYLAGDGTPIEEVSPSTRTWVVEMDWTPATPLADEMELEVQVMETGEVVGEVRGAPPLRLVLEEPAHGEMLLYGVPTTGVVPDQAVTFYSSQFKGEAPADYTAVP